MVDPVVEKALIDLFCHLADAYDAGEPLPEDLRDAYAEKMTHPEVAAFYGELVEETLKEKLGTTSAP